MYENLKYINILIMYYSNINLTLFNFIIMKYN